ncbi:TIR domain-containing protein [Pseudoalteromonas viridis]|uniref:TIR domain-containing protein n=1 Tax=Pseudoalteromonas viridis TaxID=339617 RepID=A0ABX7V2U3_9GAMM|nr:TIR domain-containing protein [Pseudoalteromonas viridis]QTL34017.1 TIR domain-containing protein [Pseudoalteromonas viridis]
MSTRQIHVFISHAWAYSEHYETLASWIFDEKWRVGQASLDFRNYSVPKNDPIHDADNDEELKEAILKQIKMSHVIVIPTGIYASYSKWIQKEIDGSSDYSKPILAVNPWGQQRASGVVVDSASKLVGWNKKSVVSGIWDLYK